MRVHLTMHFTACGMSSGENEEERRKVCKWKLFGGLVNVSSGFIPTGTTSFEVGVGGKKLGRQGVGILNEKAFAPEENGIKRPR